MDWSEWRKKYPTTKMRKIRVMREYAKEAAEMTREELEHAYVRCRFARTSFLELPKSWFDEFE